MNTTYEEIWNKFESISKFDQYDLPFTVDGRRKLIVSGVDIFNQRLFDELQCDNKLDEVGRQLTQQEIYLVANCIKLQVCNNLYTDFATTYSMYQKEVGFKDYKAQINARETMVKMQEKTIDSIVFSMLEDYEG